MPLLLAFFAGAATGHQDTLQPAAALDPDLVHAGSLLGMGKLSDAENAVRSYLMLHQRSADGHYLLGQILFRRADAKGSLAEYTEGAKYRTPRASDLLIVGCDYVELSAFADADKWFTKVVEWEPGNALGWYYLGRTKYNENRFDEAIEAFQRCLKLEPKNVKAEDNLGLSYDAMQRTAEALEAFRTAVSWEGEAPQNAWPFIDLGTALVEKNRAAEALPYLEKAIVIAPEESRAHQELGKAYLNLERLPEAQKELERAEHLAPNNAPLHFILGRVYRRTGDAERARAEFTRYAELSGTTSAPPTMGSGSPPPVHQ